MRRIIIAGSRRFNNYCLVADSVSSIIDEIGDRDIEIITGGAKGADKLGEIFAISRKYALKVFPADWEKYGSAAGPIRNKEMAKYASGENGMLIAFWNGESRGTKNMIETAERYGLEVKVVSISGKEQ